MGRHKAHQPQVHRCVENRESRQLFTVSVVSVWAVFQLFDKETKPEMKWTLCLCDVKQAITENKWVTAPKCRQIVDIDYWHAEHASKQVLP